MKKEAGYHEESSPGATTGCKVQDANQNQQHGPELPDLADGNDSHVIQKEGESNQDDDCAREHAASAPPANVYANHQGAALSASPFVLPIQVVLNIAMNLLMDGVVNFVAKLSCLVAQFAAQLFRPVLHFVAELLGIEIVFVAH